VNVQAKRGKKRQTSAWLYLSLLLSGSRGVLCKGHTRCPIPLGLVLYWEGDGGKKRRNALADVRNAKKEGCHLCTARRAGAACGIAAHALLVPVVYLCISTCAGMTDISTFSTRGKTLARATPAVPSRCCLRVYVLLRALRFASPALLLLLRVYLRHHARRPAPTPATSDALTFPPATHASRLLLDIDMVTTSRAWNIAAWWRLSVAVVSASIS